MDHSPSSPPLADFIGDGVPVPIASGRDLIIEGLPDFPDDEMGKLISSVNLYLHVNSFTDFAETNLLLMLTHALQTAAKKANSSAVEAICKIFSILNEMDHPGFISLLSKKMDVAPYTGQSFAFTLADQFYTAVINRDITSLISLNILFSRLLKDDSLFVCELSKSQSEGTSEGMTALLPFAQALLLSSQQSFDVMSSEVIANLIISILQKKEDKSTESLFQPISHKAFSGQSVLTFLANVIKSEAQNTKDFISPLIDQIIQAMQRAPKTLVNDGLTKIIQRGPEEGLNVIHIFLQAFISSAQIKNNKTVSDLLLLFRTICSCSGFSAMMVENSTAPRYLNQNGVTMLVQALVMAKDNNYDIEPIAAILEQVIAEQGHDKVLAALQQRVNYSTTTYFQLLNNSFKDNSLISPIITALTTKAPSEKTTTGIVDGGIFSVKPKLKEGEEEESKRFKPT